MSKVKKDGWWDSDADEWHEAEDSEREYREYSTGVAYIEDDYHREQRHVNLSLYVDEETGIVVSDVRKYEQWLKGLITR